MTPQRASRPCSFPGCPNLVDSREAMCREHQRAADKRKGTRQARGYTQQWIRTARSYLGQHPWCEWPLCNRDATTVDHIDGDVTNLDWSNLRALCRYHHNSRTGRDQPGGAVRG